MDYKIDIINQTENIESSIKLPSNFKNKLIALITKKDVPSYFLGH